LRKKKGPASVSTRRGKKGGRVTKISSKEGGRGGKKTATCCFCWNGKRKKMFQLHLRKRGGGKVRVTLLSDALEGESIDRIGDVSEVSREPRTEGKKDQGLPHLAGGGKKGRGF